MQPLNKTVSGGNTHGNYGDQSDGDKNANEDDNEGLLHEDSDQDVDKSKPVQLKIESKPPEKSPFDKIFTTVRFLTF